MAEQDPKGRKSGKRPAVDLRRPAGNEENAAGSLRKLKGALGRPLKLERRDGQLRVVLVERRRAAPTEAESLETRIASAVRERLARDGGGAHGQFAIVGEKFAQEGWPGIATLPPKVLDRAIDQAEALVREQASVPLALFADRLRQIKAVVESRESRRSVKRTAPAAAESVIVTEVSQEEFDALQRSWAGTEPGGLGPPIRDPSRGAR